MKVAFFIQNHHNTFVSQKEEVENHEQIPVNSNYHKNEDRAVEPYVERQSVDIMCMFDDITSFDDLPKYDQYDDNYVLQIQTNFTEKSEANLRNKEVQVQQPENSDQLVHFNYENEEESTNFFEISEGTLPFCFSLFQFIRDNYHAIRNQMSTSLDINCLEGNKIFVQDFSYLDLQHQNAIECQVAEEELEAGTYDQMIQDDSLPLCFQSFQFLKEKWYKIFNEKEEELVEIYEVPFEPICNKL